MSLGLGCQELPTLTLMLEMGAYSSERLLVGVTSILQSKDGSLDLTRKALVILLDLQVSIGEGNSES